MRQTTVGRSPALANYQLPAPGTGTPEPGGSDWYQVTALLRLVAAEENVVASDIVEVSPVPGQLVTEFLAARSTHKLMCCGEMRI